MKVKARGIVLKNNQILLMFRNKFGNIYFSIPGGGKEDIDKSLEDTVIREIFEETSIVVTVNKHLQKHIDKKHDIEQNLYLCDYVSGEVKLGNSIESEKMKREPNNFYKPMWINLKCIKELKIFPSGLSDITKDIAKKHVQ